MKSNCAAVFLTLLTEAYPTQSSLPGDADLRVQMERQAWLNGQDVQGYQIKVTVLKNKPLPSGGEVILDMISPSIGSSMEMPLHILLTEIIAQNGRLCAYTLGIYLMG